MYWSFYAVWRPTRRLSHIQVDQQGVYYVHWSFYAVWRPARRLSHFLFQCSVSIDQHGIYHVHWSFYVMWRPARCLSRVLVVLCSVATSKVFITCTGCSMQCGDQQGVYHVYWLFYAVWRPARHLSHVPFQCSLSIDQQGVYHVYRSFCSVSTDQKGVYHVYMFYAVSRPERVFITCTVGCICRFHTSKVFATCTGCSIQFLDQQGVSHLHWPVTAVLRPSATRWMATVHTTRYKQTSEVYHSLLPSLFA